MSNREEQQFIPAQAEASAVDEAAQQAIELIEKFGALDPHDLSNADNPWRHPEQVFAELDAARTKLTDAWEAFKSKMETCKDESSEKQSSFKEDFRVAYTNMVTDAFADVLEDLRNKNEDIDVDVLVDCLQSGMEIMTQDEKELFMEESDVVDEDTEEQDSKLTPHEARRRQLGYHVEAPA